MGTDHQGSRGIRGYMLQQTLTYYLAVESVFDEQQMNNFGTGGGSPVDYNTDNDVQILEVSLSLSEQEQ